MIIDMKLFTDTVETRMKEPAFVRTSKLKFNLLGPLNEDPLEDEAGRGCYTIGFISPE